MRNGLRTLLLVLLALGVCAVPFSLKRARPALSGTVLDPKGAVVAGAAVKVVNNDDRTGVFFADDR